MYVEITNIVHVESIIFNFVTIIDFLEGRGRVG